VRHRIDADVRFERRERLIDPAQHVVLRAVEERRLPGRARGLVLDAKVQMRGPLRHELREYVRTRDRVDGRKLL